MVHGHILIMTNHSFQLTNWTVRVLKCVKGRVIRLHRALTLRGVGCGARGQHPLLQEAARPQSGEQGYRIETVSQCCRELLDGLFDS